MVMPRRDALVSYPSTKNIFMIANTGGNSFAVMRKFSWFLFPAYFKEFDAGYKGASCTKTRKSIEPLSSEANWRIYHSEGAMSRTPTNPSAMARLRIIQSP